MRVIAGQAKGQRLKSNASNEVRPTLDRVKEALFNIIGPEIIDIDLLDLYAGFGGLGIEALSRGAKSATFIEKANNQVKVITENLELTNFKDRAKVIQGEVLTKLNRFKPESFDIILMDPPYNQGLVIPTIQKALDYQLLKRAGIIAVEHHEKDEINQDFTGLKLIRKRDYGDTRISLYMKVEKGE
ncbi:16S rRNA (guanine(966)-N(2))-methyltransferase RsmD [Selenihalanaerobacter shriftii]|uniref:16S rRNA (Guanine966-N2)-methyltransferase n=1 Tax=Selenihalanaerobacter shriftii TaxID=142842 RepID=A0A1T4JJG4_9FIRM|nr:16S rRNA (guanine(966)-N(2))-methyltransferase RsmD [Selenihalanaerobacter shriftii]SJZ30268.1 16S rRNA (guanine966-N2)-methyltransferase [Selenihalanaerobacter shriftii]